MSRCLTVLSLALLTACAVDTPAEDIPTVSFERHQDRPAPSAEGQALVAVAYAQSDVESVLELGVLDVFSDTPYPAHQGLASCVHVPVPEDVMWLEGECNEVGSWGYEIILDRCTLGPGAPVSGSLFVSYYGMSHLDYTATEAEVRQAVKQVNKARVADELSAEIDLYLTSGDENTIRACGSWSGTTDEHVTEFEAQVPLDEEAQANIHWSGHSSDYHSKDWGRFWVRDGLLHARLTGEDGSVHDLDMVVADNVRREWARFPERGRVEMDSSAASLRYLYSTRYTGEVMITQADGSVRTHHLNLE